MTDTPILAESFKELDDQLWRRLGITQTFDRLLVQATGEAPGTADSVRERVGSKLSGGAAKFWDLSFPQLLKDLCRREILTHEAGALALAEEFHSKLTRLLHDQHDGVSHVDPTPGVTLAQVLEKAARREERAKAKRTPRKRVVAVARRAAKARTASAASSAPRRRAATSESTPTEAPAATPKATVLVPPNKLFTSLKLNKLLDSLDNSQSLMKSQLGTRLKLHGPSLARFLEVTNIVELTRVTQDDFVELHWKGRELSRTSSADRRMALIEIVKTLREAAEAPADPER